MRSVFIAVLASGLFPTGTSAQFLTERDAADFVEGIAAVSLEQAGTRCLTRVPLETVAGVTDGGCRVESLAAVGSIDETRWYAARYRRSAVVSVGEAPDTMDWDEIVLLESDAAGDVVARWRITTERLFEFLRDVTAESRAEGLLIELVICLNGTGGCSKNYLLAAPAGLQLVEMAFVADLRARLTNVRSLHKGVTLDLATLRGVWPVSAPGDGNCCPSLAFDYEVQLVGARMELVRAVLQPSFQWGTPAEHVLAWRQELRDRTTFGSWRALHGTDSITSYRPDVAEDSYRDWCVRAETETAIDSVRSVRRSAYFYPPPVPDPPVLSNASAAALVDECRLGFIWAEAVDPDSARARDLARQTRDVLLSLGAPDTTTRLSWAGAASWRYGSLWRDGGTTIVSAFTNGRSWTRTLPEGVTRVLVAATAEPDVIPLEWERPAPYRTGIRRRHADWETLRPRIREMMSLMQPDTQAARGLRTFITILDTLLIANRAPSDAELATLPDVMRRWLTPAAGMPPARRAAALVAADLVIQSVERHIGWLGHPPRAPERERLVALGAEFDFSPLGDYHVYTHPWLKEALRIDADGRAGELAFLGLIEMGFETSGTCSDQGTDGFRTVIERGEEHLRRRPSSAIATDVRFLIAEAWSDIVYVANGGDYHEPDVSAYIAEAPAARERAIAMYRAAFADAGASPRARESWPNAWRLMAGLTPTRSHFYCIYD